MENMVKDKIACFYWNLWLGSSRNSLNKSDCKFSRVAVLRGRTRLENWRPRGQASLPQSAETPGWTPGSFQQETAWQLLLADPPSLFSWPLRTENCPPHRVVLKIQHTDGRRCRENHKVRNKAPCSIPAFSLPWAWWVCFRHKESDPLSSGGFLKGGSTNPTSPAPPNFPLLQPPPIVAKDGDMGHLLRNLPSLTSQTMISWGQRLPPQLCPALDISSSPT